MWQELAHADYLYVQIVSNLYIYFSQLTVYQLSSHYGLLNRLLYYALIAFSVASHSHVWLVAGALTSAMTYSGTVTIHGFILAIDSKNFLYDIDTVGVWAVVSIGCLVVNPMLYSSTTIPRVPSRLIFKF